MACVHDLYLSYADKCRTLKENKKRERTAMTKIANNIRKSIRRLASFDPSHEVHFHQGPQGQPAPCFDARCANPRLDA
jgi:hypothetical protein